MIICNSLKRHIHRKHSTIILLAITRGLCTFQVLFIMHIGFFACFHAISLERSRFSKIATLFFYVLVALKLLVSFISRLVACGARIVVDRQTDTQTLDTYTQTKYCNLRCACASTAYVLVALKLLVSFISRLVACSARIVVDRQTDTQTLDTYIQTKYCNLSLTLDPKDYSISLLCCIVSSKGNG